MKYVEYIFSCYITNTKDPVLIKDIIMAELFLKTNHISNGISQLTRGNQNMNVLIFLRITFAANRFDLMVSALASKQRSSLFNFW